jgi:small subunit ribosomal protein S1
MDSFETVAGAEAPAEATAEMENEQVVEVEAVDQDDMDEMEGEQVIEVEAVDPGDSGDMGTDQVIEVEAGDPGDSGDMGMDQVIDAKAVDQEVADKLGDPDEDEMGNLPVSDWDYQRPERGEVRPGVILSVSDQEVIVDIGGKHDGIVPYSDLQRMGAEEVAKLSPGDEVLVYVLHPEDQDGNLVLSLNMARQEKAWRRAQELADSGEVWEGEVEGYNKGGLVVPLEDIRGFVPASQIPGFPRGLNQEERIAQLAEMVGMKLQLKVIEIDRRKRRLILSATTAMRQWRKQQREKLLDDLREGEVCTGVVSSLCSFGAFVDLGGADGLIHLSELSWRRVRHPRELLKVGQEIEVYVLRLDHDKRRIGLSLKRLQPEPWALVEDKYELGQLVEGIVTNVVDFGAFAEIEEGIEGLIHVSELSEAQVSHPKDVVKKGDLLLLRIIRIDPRRKRLGLSLKRVLEAEWAEWAALLAEAEAERQEEPVAEESAEPVGESADAIAEECDEDGALVTLAEEPEDEAGESEMVDIAGVMDEESQDTFTPEPESADAVVVMDEAGQAPSVLESDASEPDLL